MQGSEKETARGLRFVLVWFVLVAGPVLSGCVGATAQLLYMIHGIKVSAEFDGLKNKRVAVVCVSDSSVYGADSASETLARLIGATLRKNVKGIQLVSQDEVLDWIDNHQWDQIDFTQIGRGVRADMLLAVELSSYRLTSGKTLYQGQADVTITVYDISKGGEAVFRRELPQFQFPVSGGRPTTDISRAQFEKQFLFMLSQKIANYFYDYEMVEDFGRDAALIGQ